MAEQSCEYSDSWFGQWPYSEKNVKGFTFCAKWLGFEESVKDPPAAKDLPRMRKDLSQENLEFYENFESGLGRKEWCAF